MPAEHVAAHDRCPNIGEFLFENRRVCVHDASRHSLLRAPHRQLDDPLVQPITADPEGVVHALVRAGDEAVERHGDAETQFGHLENGMASVGKAVPTISDEVLPVP
jgi:hypothetical protein